MTIRSSRSGAQRRMPRAMATRMTTAFTLVELLVVISVLGVLASLTMAVIGQVQTAARRTVCAGNLRQIGLALIAYATDNEARFPQNNHIDCSSWPYGFGDWGTGAWGGKSDFYQDFLPAPRTTYYCPDGLRAAVVSAPLMLDSYRSFPIKPATNWISEINYCYFAGPNEAGTNSRGGPIGLWDGNPRSTLIADLMRFGQTDYTLSTVWNHLGTTVIAGGTRLAERSGGNMFHLDGHVGWASGTTELLKHRQKMKGNDTKSYCAEQKNDP